MDMLRFLLFLVLAPVSLTEARTLQQLPVDAVVLAGEPAAADAAAIAALKSAASDGLVAALERMGPAQFEAAAQALLAELIERRPTADEWGAVEVLRGHEPRLWRRHPETAADWYEPVLDIAGMAARVQAHWRFEDAVSALQRQPPEWKLWLQAEPAVLAGLLGRLPQEDLDARTEAGVPPGLGSGPWLVLLLRSAQARLWEQALVDAPDEALRRAAPAVWAIGPAAARAWLERLRVKRTALRSVAVFAYARDPDASVRQGRMQALLADPIDRAAAAAVLAQDAQLSDVELIRLLEDADAAAEAGHVLALRLRDSAATRAHLLRRQADGTGRLQWQGENP